MEQIILPQGPECTLDCTQVSEPFAGSNYKKGTGGQQMLEVLRNVWRDDEGQDIAEYAVMLAVILVIVVGTIRLVGSNANTVFSQTASAIG